MTEFDSSELWLPVVGYEGYYEVSNFGRVRSVPRVVEGRWGPTKRLGCVLALKPANGKYLKATLCKDGVLTQHQVHRLVLLAFVGEPPSDFQCDHIDSDIRNNSLNNLRWLSQADNLRKRLSVKLTEETVAAIRAKAASGVETAKLAVEFGVSKRHVRQVVTAKRWKDTV